MKLILITLFMILGPSTFAQTQVIKLALNWKAEPQFGGFYEMTRNSQQILEKKVEIIQGGSGTPTLQMILSNQVDLGVVSGDELLISRDRGSDLVALFAVYQKNPQAIMVHPENKVRNIQDLLNSNGTLLWQSGLPYAQFLQKRHPNAKIKLAPYSGGITLFLKDKTISQQCFYTAEPLQVKKLGFTPRVFLVADEGFNPYTTVLVARKKFIDQNKIWIEALQSSLTASWLSYLANPRPSNIIMNKLNPSMDLETFQQSALSQSELIISNQIKNPGQMELKRWKELQKQLNEINLVKNSEAPQDLFLNPK